MFFFNQNVIIVVSPDWNMATNDEDAFNAIMEARARQAKQKARSTEALNAYAEEVDLGMRNLDAIPLNVVHDGLRVLKVNNNRICSLPESLFPALSGLTSLDLSWNQLAALPDSISAVSNLTSLDISFNPLTKLPSALGNLVLLRRLTATDCQLCELPAELGNLQALSFLHLQYNSLTALPEPVSALLESPSFDMNTRGNPLKVRVQVRVRSAFQFPSTQP